MQDFDVYKENVSRLNEMENVYNSFADISTVSESDARWIISRANQFLEDFVEQTESADQDIQQGIQNVASNTAAAIRWSASRAGLPSEVASLQTNRILQDANLQRAQQRSLTDQRIAEAAWTFLNMQAGVVNQNIANQLNAQQLQEASRSIWWWSPAQNVTATEEDVNYNYDWIEEDILWIINESTISFAIRDEEMEEFWESASNKNKLLEEIAKAYEEEDWPRTISLIGVYTRDFYNQN